jgi:hypothetical protein
MFVMISPTGARVVFVTHTDGFHVDVDYVVDNFHAKFKITPVTTGVMLGVDVSAGVDANGVRYVELTQIDYIERMYAEVSRFMKDGYKVACQTITHVLPFWL